MVLKKKGKEEEDAKSISETNKKIYIKYSQQKRQMRTGQISKLTEVIWKSQIPQTP